MQHLGRSIAVKENAISHEKCNALMTLIDNSPSLIQEQSKDNGSYSSETRYTSIGLTMNNSPKLDQMVRALLVTSLNEYRHMVSAY